MNKKNPQKEEQINIDGRAAIAVVATLAVLVMCLIVMFVGVALDASDNGGAIMSSGGGGGGGKNNSVQAGNQVPSSTPSAKTGMQLPSATKGGSYLSASASDVQTIDNISSEHAILVNMTKNQSIAEKGADVKIHPASMTKVMTLIVVCENAKDPTALLTVTEDMYNRRKDLGGSGLLSEHTVLNDQSAVDILGKAVSVEDAMHLLAYHSDTVACLLLAEHIAGSESAFVDMMNKRAKDFGLENTEFVNCTGLTEPDGTYNQITARDMAGVMAAAMNNSVAKDILTAYGKYEKYSVDIYEEGKALDATLTFYPSWKQERFGNDMVAGKVTIMGAKTGMEDISSYCLVTYAKSKSAEYICVTIGKSPTSSGGIKMAQAAADTRAIYKKYVTE